MSDVVVESTDSVSDNPAISHEEYLELVAMRQAVLELKAQKADVLEFVTVAQQYAAQLQGANERLNVLNESLNENTSALQQRMREIVGPHNVEGEFTISDSEPHYIIPNE